MAGSQSYCSWLMLMIVPTLCVGMPQWTLRVRFGRDAERPGLHSHAERGTSVGAGLICCRESRSWPCVPDL
ncbi:hypothetical protein EJA71_18980 [Pseudomonas sp. PB106]|nr:hypothetical protein EJA71_18980 [Pseudomonas sp. PB106]